MKFRGFIIGIAMAALFFGLLVMVRLFSAEIVFSEEKVVELPAEFTMSSAPPPPAILEETLPELECSNSPLLELSSVSSLILNLPALEIPLDANLAVDVFTQDLMPAVLPKAPAKVVNHSRVRRTSSRALIAPKPVANAAPIGLGELDRKPSLIRRGRLVWPSSVRNLKSGGCGASCGDRYVRENSRIEHEKFSK